MATNNSANNIHSDISLKFNENTGVLHTADGLCRIFDFDFDRNRKIVYVKNIERPHRCPNCKSINIKRKGETTSRTINDVFNQIPVKVVVERYRYRCNKCGQTFTDDIYPEKIKYTSEYENYLAQIMLDEIRSFRDRSRRYDISIGHLSKALDHYIKRFKDQNFLLESCSYLYFHKFFYHGTACCCVCGFNSIETNDLKLLEIYDEYSPKIVEIVYKKLTSINKVLVIFHDYDPLVTAALQAQFNGKTVIIHEKNFIDRAENIKSKHNQTINNTSITPNALIPEGMVGQQMLGYIEYIKTNIHGINVAFNLENELARKHPEVRNAFSKLISNLKENEKAFKNLAKFKNIEFNLSPIINKIKKYNDNNTPFQVMHLRMMILNKDLRKKLKRTCLGTYLTQDPPTIFRLYNNTQIRPIKKTYHYRSVGVKELVA